MSSDWFAACLTLYFADTAAFKSRISIASPQATNLGRPHSRLWLSRRRRRSHGIFRVPQDVKKKQKKIGSAIDNDLALIKG